MTHPPMTIKLCAANILETAIRQLINIVSVENILHHTKQVH